MNDATRQFVNSKIKDGIADLRGADLTDANLGGANLTGATLPEGYAQEVK